MRYMGSKARFAKEIIEAVDRQGIWIEPFVGGGGLIRNVQGQRYGSDLNQYIVSLLIACRDGWAPPNNLTLEEYLVIKENREDYPEHLVGFAGFCCSFAGKFFGGYARGQGRNFADESSRALVREAELFKDVELEVKDYRDVNYGTGNTIVFDPPYADTTKYSQNFNSDEFWEFAEGLSKNNNVYVCEYSSPKNYEIVWQKKTNSSLTVESRSSKVSTEKLFRVL